ncbi:MAG: insulinase family protein [Acidobacteriota bacterium]|nr:insulinase family protein [Acidobacteriota bacterium]
MFRPLAPFLAAAFCSMAAVAQDPPPSPPLPGLTEQRLANGADLILVSRPGSGAFHASLFFRQGGVDEPPQLLGATEILARCLLGPAWPEDLEEDATLDAMLTQEDGLAEELRVARLQAKGPSPRVDDLKAAHDAVMARLEARFDHTASGEIYGRAGGGDSQAVDTRDFLASGVELPTSAFHLWCETESDRLRHMVLSRLPFARASLVADLRSGAFPKDPAVAVLLGAALPGHPYGRNLADYAAAVAALRRDELRAYAQRACGPGRMAIVLVGDLDPASALPELQKTLGALPETEPPEAPVLPDLNLALGDRRVQIQGEGFRLLVGWRIPARTDPDAPALELIARILGGGPSARLSRRLKGLATDISVTAGRPGARYPNLLVVDAEPLPGHSLQEVEDAVESEILRLRQTPVSQDEWNRAIAQLDLARLDTESDASDLTAALGVAWAQTGSWRGFTGDEARLRAAGPEALQRAAATWLLPSHRTLVEVVPDPSHRLDEQDRAFMEVLRALAARKVEDPAQRESLVGEGLRQFQMLPQAERAKTLDLLRQQLKGAK